MESRVFDSQQQEHLLDLHDGSGFASDPKTWLTGDDISRTLSSLSDMAASASATGNVDRELFNDLVEMVPLVQSLIERKPNSSFTRRGSMVYTKVPKATGKSAASKKNRDRGDKDQNYNAANNVDGCAENFSVRSSGSLLSEKDREELVALRDQVEDLKRQISEKDELLKSAELAKNEMASLQTKFDELTIEVSEKDSLIKSTHQQLSDLKIKLADKQAAVEKLQWEAVTSKSKVEKLQEDLDKAQGEISSFMLFIQSLTRNDVEMSPEDYDDVSYPLDDNSELDYEMDVQKLEAAREAYITAVAIAKERQNEESIAAAASARFHLQSLIASQT
ncbi:protein MICROTUBULE BINDING PROTEIN 2C [Andrographis paniculata]|uniref:protein MICROTUBULE BINDING PROTEIN 2C n=1 Tax=Andrographis paniculata TaxID=175694 RepID=UPI0021E8094A|nr:protein MICROTUBULE BINDING PROTEIN 2C [Andrographis paniculata]